MWELCEMWIHTDYASIGETQYKTLKESHLQWYCPCCNMELPFLKVENKDIQILPNDPHNIYPKPIPKKMNKKTKEILKKFHEMSQIFQQSENPLICDYYDISDFKKLKINKQQDLSILHLNISSISAHIGDLRAFLNLVNHIDLPDFHIEQTPTECSAGGTLIYIFQNLSYKPRKDLQIYCPKKFESTFIGVLIPNKKSHLIGVFYKHSSMKHYKFKNIFMTTVL